MAAGYLAGRSMTQHGRVAEEIRIWKNLATGEEPQTYRMAFNGQGRPVELPSGGITRTSGDEDGNAGPFSSTACPGHRGCFGG